MADWVREQLGDLHARRSRSCPTRCRSASPRAPGSTHPLIVAAGRLVNEKQYDRLIEAFAAGRRPAPRLAAADLRHRAQAPGAAPAGPQARAVRPRRAARRGRRHARRVGQGQHLRADLPRRGLPARGPGGDGRRRARSPATTAPRARARSSSTRSTACSSPPSRSPAWRRALLRLATDDDLRHAPRRGRLPHRPASTTPTRSPNGGWASSREARSRARRPVGSRRG